MEYLNFNGYFLLTFKINRDIRRDKEKFLIEGGMTQDLLTFQFKHKSIVSKAVHRLEDEGFMAIFKLGQFNYLFITKKYLDLYLRGYSQVFIETFYDTHVERCECGEFYETNIYLNDIRQWCNNCQKYYLNGHFFYIDNVFESNYPIIKDERNNNYLMYKRIIEKTKENDSFLKNRKTRKILRKLSFKITQQK